MSDDKLGTRIDVEQMKKADLEYPGSEPPEDLFDSAETVEEPFQDKPKAPEAPKSKKPKLSKQLQKFRETFGRSQIKLKKHTITRYLDDGEKVSMTFGMRALNYEDYQWILIKAATMQDTIPFAFATNMTTVAMSVCSMDTENTTTPIHEVLGIEGNNIQDPFYPPSKIRMEAAEALLDELKDSLYDVVEELYSEVVGYLDQQKKAIEQEKEQEGPLD